MYHPFCFRSYNFPTLFIVATSDLITAIQKSSSYRNRPESECLTLSPLSCRSGLYSLSWKYRACPQTPTSNYIASVLQTYYYLLLLTSPNEKRTRLVTDWLVCLHARATSFGKSSRIPSYHLPIHDRPFKDKLSNSRRWLCKAYIYYCHVMLHL
jgi:hypothetical protein